MRANRYLRPVASVAAAGLLALMPQASHADPTRVNVLGQEFSVDPDCTVEDPTVYLDADDGRRVTIDVLVLLDGVSQTQAEGIFANVGGPYDEIGLDVAVTYQVASPAFTSSTNAGDLIHDAQNRFPDKKVPAEYDMVEVLTDKDIEYGGDRGVVGLAYCLGGARDRTLAYEVSEAGPPPTQAPAAQGGPGIGIPSLPPIPKMYAKATAHEMGHLFGGQHQYANCVQGIDPAEDLQDHSLCTLMFADIRSISLHFSTLNARLVRGYALRYAAGNDS